MRFKAMSFMGAMGLLFLSTLLLITRSPRPRLRDQGSSNSVGQAERNHASWNGSHSDKLAPNDMRFHPVTIEAPAAIKVEVVPATPPIPQFILLLSSTPRSGSTFIGELISTHKSMVYFFEPLHKIRSDPCVKDAQCLSSYLADKFTCSIDENFRKWFHSKFMFNAFFSNTTKACQKLDEKEKKSCVYNVDFQKECLESDTRLIKAVRARMDLVSSLLDLFPQLKIVHLYRDPRGFMKSIKKFKNWNHESSTYCSGLEQDWLASKNILESKEHSQQLTQLSYEDLSRDPIGRTQSLFKFLFGSSDLGESTLSYLETHTKSEVKGPMSTLKNSQTAAEAWRYSITEGMLNEIENDPHCRACIQLMKHRLFDSLKNAKNESISLYLSDG